MEAEINRNEVPTRSECSTVSTVQDTFSRANVVSRDSQVRLVDSDEETNLDLFCYVRCDNNEDDFVKQCRGLVYQGDTLVMKAFSYTAEYNTDELSKLETILADFSKWTFYKAYEGALLRLFYFSGRWFLSTHRKLNAFRSKWSSRESFGTLFKRALERELNLNKNFREGLGEGENILDRFQNTLDKTKQYMFLLRNGQDNRIVCLPPDEKEPLVYHVGTFCDGVLSMKEQCNLYTPEEYKFEDLSKLLTFVETETDPRNSQGIVCFGPNNVQLKILQKEYQEMFHARGNEPSVKFRYLQVRMNRKMTEMLYKLYPEMREVFDDYENTIYDVARSIYHAYVQRFIKKRWVTVPREEYKVIEDCHTWHLTDRTNNRISLERIIYLLNKQTPTNLNHMIRRYKTEQLNKKTVNPRSVKGSRNNSAVNSPAITGLSGPVFEPLVLRRV